MSAPGDSLSAAAIAAALSGSRLGHPVRFLPQVGSTNDVAHAEARAGAPDGLLVVAEEQTAGRGREARRWWAPPGCCLLMSLLLRPARPPSGPMALTMCLGLGTVEGIEEATGVRPALKWPNDVVYGDRKLAGMLSELGIAGEGWDYAVLGLGLNVNLDLSDPSLPAEVPSVATSLQEILGRHVPRLPLLAAIVQRSAFWYDGWLAGQSPHSAWAARLDTLGRAVMVTMPHETLRGVATGVTPEGALQVRAQDGSLRTVWAGDVANLRLE